MMPHEFGDAPVPSQYFMTCAFYASLERGDRAERLDVPGAEQAQDLLDQYR